MRPSRMCSGCHVTFALFATTRSFSVLVRMNQERRAYWISGSSGARGQKGYSW
jgi:hypothetical protein